MNKYVVVMQNNLKKSSGSVFNFVLKVLSGALIGLTLALIGQEVFKFGNFLFVFVIMMTTSVFLVVSRKWTTMVVFIFNLFCVLLALLLRMYALVAPGA